jgi:HemY protein
MKWGLVVILTLALAALVTHFLLQDNGYVLINFQGYAVTMSVPILAFLLLLAYFAVRVLVQIWRAPRRLGEYTAARRIRKANELITRGYIEMGEGNFARGEKLLTRGVRNSETPLLNYLAAARAAQAQGDRQRRDNWLKMAYEQEPRASASVLLTQAELQLANNELEPARASLQRVLEQTPKHVEALRMLAGLCVSQQNWAELETLLPKLRRLAKKAPDKLDDWTVETWRHLLAAAAEDQMRGRDLLKRLPKHLRNDPRIQRAQIEACIADGRIDEAEKLIRKALDGNWNEELILLYGKLESPAKATLLKRAENWLRQRPEDPALLLTAGRLCVQNELWGKARSYFETSIGIRPSPEAWHDLGQLLSRMGEAESASKAYQKGLTLSYGGTEVPRLTSRKDPMADE